ncbi:uncharacterized protein VTP21DRAFT_5984 [Calcarisporiella thermophila]|uniref:uncharacterized protein n=1 Tax=Calcarisporiella thermophila TaxID=911321 RepID=UPI003742670C
MRILLVGLGNWSMPRTRHSIGMTLIDYLAESLGTTWQMDRRFPAAIANGSTYVQIQSNKNGSKQVQRQKKQNIIDLRAAGDVNSQSSKLTETSGVSISESRANDPVLVNFTLVKPRLYMNENGKAVARIVKELGFDTKDVVVLHDDLERELGKIGVKMGGSANGHNGVKSIIASLKTDKFTRLRIGIGRPPASTDDRSFNVVSDYVLGEITSAEMRTVQEKVWPWVREWVESGKFGSKPAL